MLDKNLSGSAIKVFNILAQIIEKPCDFKVLTDGISDDSLTIYLNTLRKTGIKISKNKKSSKNKVSGSFNIFNFNDFDVTVFAKIKEILTIKGEIDDIINFNIFLENIMNYACMDMIEKIEKVVNSPPFSSKMHEKIINLQLHIKNKTAIKIIYNSHHCGEKEFDVIPLFLGIKNSKLYLWCNDNSINDLRCFKFDRILNFFKTNEKITTKNFVQYAICKVNKNINIDKSEILEEKENQKIVKIYYLNSFEILQTILELGNQCEIIEPLDLKKEFINTIKSVRSLYE